MFDALNNPARKSADISPAVAPDFRLVANAAQRHANEIPPKCAGNGTAQRRLAYARRADETKNRAFDFFFELIDGQVFENSFFDFFQIVVVFVEHLLGFFNVEIVLGFLSPGKIDKPVEVGPNQGCLGRLGMHLLEAAQLLFRFALYFARHFGFGDLLSELVHFFGPLIAFTQLLLNLFELLAQEIVPLRFAHLFLGLILDARLHRRKLELRDSEAH